MGSHPVNLFIRFLLEIFALYSIGMWSWRLTDIWFRYILVISIPLIIILIWWGFAVPNDPSRSGKSPIPTNGLIRLIIELSIFGFAVLALNNIGNNIASIVLGVSVLIHYLVSYNRVFWLLSK
ncbi:YrdB family protein [Pontimicrobium aquaticum]|uniref:DUF2568 domain-containing protein n=1 Tax=Pontimicrobium aquaticum TaxID=2565367 RepID=A0A4U0EQB1_9FLAO|nr:YrdB family protein [Pontimicrobium aquaticum]TJY33885.1 DUF2568 domain-containing protein [Pontimicrobium aquaticum]